jgi:hypothetical protein
MTIDDQPTQSVFFAPSVSTLASKSNVQGTSELIYCVNRAAYHPQHNHNRPAWYPVPEISRRSVNLCMIHL